MAELTDEQSNALASLMEGCAQAIFEDREWNAPVYLNGEVVGGNGCNAYEAADVLNAVAAILGLDSPTDISDAMYGASDG